MDNLTDEELAAIGTQVVAWFDLKKDREHKDRYVTQYGTKTLIGLGAVAVRLVKEKGKSADGSAVLQRLMKGQS